MLSVHVLFLFYNLQITDTLRFGTAHGNLYIYMYNIMAEKT